MSEGSAEVLAVLQRTVAADPADLIARHNLGVELRRFDRAGEALVEIEGALRRGLRAPETATMRAHLLADLGRFDEAVAQYRALLEVTPEFLDAHETLARLLPQIGRAAEALDAYRAALARAPHAGMLWVSAMRSAADLHDDQQLFIWARDAERRFGRDALVDVFTATALSRLGDDERARAMLAETLTTEPDDLPARLLLAHVLIRLGDMQGAEAAAQRVSAVDPTNQAAWSLLTALWRVLGDPREHWLADYERLVMTIALEPVDLSGIAARLTGMHATTSAPAEQSLRGGTQTRGNLFDRRDPTIQALARTIRGEVGTALAALPIDSTHPFLMRNTRAITFAGSWSVRLRSEGFHISHMHAGGWISSALYVTLPPEVSGSHEAGALAFGVPDAALGLDLPPRRVIPAREGQLVIFPSYVWHGTLPFRSECPRLTVAFDAVPVDMGGIAR